MISSADWFSSSLCGAFICGISIFIFVIGSSFVLGMAMKDFLPAWYMVYTFSVANMKRDPEVRVF